MTAELPAKGHFVTHAITGMRGLICGVRFAVGEAPATIDVRWGDEPARPRTYDMGTLHLVRSKHWRIDAD